MSRLRQTAALLLPMSCGCWLATTAGIAQAARWQVESQWTASAQADDNLGLRSAQRDRALSGVLGFSLDAARDTETLSTKLSAGSALEARFGDSRDQRAQGRFALTQTLSGERDSFSAEAGVAADSPEAAAAGNLDVLLGNGQRQVRNLALGWTHRWSERLSLQTSASHARTGYTELTSAATDFAETGVSAALSYRLSELSTASLSWSRSSYRADQGGDSDSDSLRLSVSRQLSEAASATFGIGGFRSRRDGSVQRLACPLPISFCESGLVPFVLVQQPLTSRSDGGSFSGTLQWQFDETSALAARASRDLSSSGLGVVRGDSWAVTLNRSFTPTWSAALALAGTRSSTLGDAGVQPRALRTLSLDLAHPLSEQRSLTIGVALREAPGGDGFAAARSHRLSIALRSSGPRWAP